MIPISCLEIELESLKGHIAEFEKRLQVFKQRKEEIENEIQRRNISRIKGDESKIESYDRNNLLKN